MEMNDTEEKKVKQLNADMEPRLFDMFEAQRKNRGLVKKSAVSAAIRLWISLPSDVQVRLMDATVPEDAYQEIVMDLIDNHLTDFIKTQVQEEIHRLKKKGQLNRGLDSDLEAAFPTGRKDKKPTPDQQSQAGT
jgi:hypothetical protein